MSVGRWTMCVAIAGATLFAVGALFHFAQLDAISEEFKNEALFRPWSGWTSTYMALHPFGFGAAFATV